MFRLKNAENRLGQREISHSSPNPPGDTGSGGIWGQAWHGAFFCRDGSAYVSIRRSSVRARLR